jgi:hypothetical protein
VINIIMWIRDMGCYNIPARPTNPTMTTWFTTARGDNLDDTLERAAHPSRSSVSTTCRFSAISSLPCSPFRTRATWCGVSVWPPLVTPSFRPTMRIGGYHTLCPACELPTSGGHSDGHSPVPPSGGVRRSGEGQEPRRQGHLEG